MKRKSQGLYGIDMFYKDGIVKRSYIWTKSLGVARRWQKQMLLNELVREAKIVKK
jgi:hypothetical protein